MIILQLIISTVSIICIILISVFIFNGGTIFDLMTLSGFRYIEDEVVKDINYIFDETNNSSVVMIAESDVFIHTGTRNNITFVPLLNSVKVELYNKTTITVPIKDINRLIPLFIRFKKEFNYTPYLDV